MAPKEVGGELCAYDEKKGEGSRMGNVVLCVCITVYDLL